MLLCLGLPSFNTVLINQRVSLNLRISSTANNLVQHAGVLVIVMSSFSSRFLVP
jgi:hypothetical protein